MSTMSEDLLDYWLRIITLLFPPRYNQFDPDHHAHTSNSVSTDKWRISIDVLNS